MTLLKDSLIMLTILVVSIWVMPATSTVTLDDLKGYCRDVYKIIGFKDNGEDYTNKISREVSDDEYNKLGEIYVNMNKCLIPESGTIQFTVEQKNIFTTNFYTDFRKYLDDKIANKNSMLVFLMVQNDLEKNPVTAFCNTKIDEDNSYLKQKFGIPFLVTPHIDLLEVEHST